MAELSEGAVVIPAMLHFVKEWRCVLCGGHTLNIREHLARAHGRVRAEA